MTRVLVVCLGNICRSPTAEAVLRAKAQERGIDVSIDSAGTGAWHIGDPPHGPAISEGRNRGYDLTPLRARKFTADDFTQFDLILGMDTDNISDIEALRPAGNATPVRLMTSYAEGLPDAVHDPYYSGDFAGAFDLIERAADALLASIAAP